MAFSGDGTMLLSQMTTRTPECPILMPEWLVGVIKVRDASNGALLASLPETHNSTCHSACFSPCGSYIASTSDDKALLWRASDWSCIAKVSGGDGAAVTHVAISPDGRVLCWGTEAGTVFFRRIHDLVSANQD